MKLIVNGQPRQVEAGTLAQLLAELGYEGDWLATAVNGEAIGRPQRSAFPIAEGDRIEILSPMQGG